jgi:hypothetical protein
MLLHINGQLTMGEMTSSICSEVLFLTGPVCHFRDVCQSMKQT